MLFVNALSVCTEPPSSFLVFMDDFLEFDSKVNISIRPCRYFVCYCFFFFAAVSQFISHHFRDSNDRIFFIRNRYTLDRDHTK